MSVAKIISLANDPTIRRLAKAGGKALIRGVGKSRQRRARKGRWYLGRNVGLGPTITAPVAVSRAYTAPNANQVVSGTEVVLTITAYNATTTISHVKLNPAHEGFFPRLSATLQTYQRWKIDALSFDYLPQLPTSTIGQVGFAMLSDPAAAQPTTVEEFMSLNGARMVNVWQPCHITVPPMLLNKLSNEFITDQAENTADLAELRQACAGLLTIIVNNVPKGYVPGQLRANYRVRVIDPCNNIDMTPTAALVYDGGAVANGAAYDPASFVGGWSMFESTDTGEYQFLRKYSLKPAVVVAFNSLTAGLDIPSFCRRNVADGTPTALVPDKTIDTTEMRVRVWKVVAGRGDYEFVSQGGTAPKMSLLVFPCRKDTPVSALSIV